MTWEKSIYDVASFRGVEFFVESHDVDGIGRSLVKHEYAGSDTAYVEDMGKKTREYSLKAYLLGENYLEQRDSLMKALDAPGAGELLHPWFGRLWVKVDDAHLSETTANGGMATFDLVFVPDDGNPAPEYSVVTQDDVQDKADSVQKAANDSFEKNFNTTGQPAWGIAALTERLNELSATLGSETSKLAAKLGQPGQLATALNDSVRRLMATSRLALETLQSIDGTWPKTPAIGSIGQRQARNQYAIASLIKTTALAEYTRQMATVTFYSQEEGTAALEQISSAIDRVQHSVSPMGEPVDDDVYFALQDLRASVAADIYQRGLHLPAVTSFTPAATMPALLIAHQLYGDASQAEDIVQRNNIKHPGFVAGGQPLEVLRGSDV